MKLLPPSIELVFSRISVCCCQLPRAVLHGSLLIKLLPKVSQVAVGTADPRRCPLEVMRFRGRMFFPLSTHVLSSKQAHFKPCLLRHPLPCSPLTLRGHSFDVGRLLDSSFFGLDPFWFGRQPQGEISEFLNSLCFLFPVELESLPLCCK